MDECLTIKLLFHYSFFFTRNIKCLIQMVENYITNLSLNMDHECDCGT